MKPLANLTERQREILCLATWTNRRIAVELGINERSVKGHFTKIYRSLLGQAHYRAPRSGRTRALIRALQCGLIEFEDIAPCDERNGEADENSEVSQASLVRRRDLDYAVVGARR